MAAEKQKQNETEVLVPLPTKVACLDGTTLDVPVPSLGTETKILRLLKDVFNQAVAAGLFTANTDEAGNVIPIDEKAVASQLLDLLFTEVPEKLASAVAILIHQEEDFVNEKLDLEKSLEVLLPFLLNRRGRITKVLGKHLQIAT